MIVITIVSVSNPGGWHGYRAWIIVNLQMEGASGSSGPSGDTYYRARNLSVGRTNNGWSDSPR
jgi:hypothetical protein